MVKFILTEDEQKSIREFFIAKMKTMTTDQWAYWSMDQDGWESDLEACLSEGRWLALQGVMEEMGEFPHPTVAQFLATLEVEVYGRVVCE